MAQAHSVMHISIRACFLCFFSTLPICPFLIFHLLIYNIVKERDEGFARIAEIVD